MTATSDLTRRDFVRVGAAAGVGLTLAFYLPGCAPEDKAGTGSAGGKDAFEPNAFLRIGPDGSVTVVSKHLEMGQGTYTGLATIVAEELDADWSQVRVEGAPADAKRYNNLSWGPAQGTGGSSSIANSWEQLRKAGATARAMLVAAAAADWGVPAAEITVENGVVRHGGSSRKAGFGELAAKAAKLSPPAEVALKDPKSFTLHRPPRAAAAHRHRRQDARHRGLHPGQDARRDAHGAGGAPAALRRHGEVVRRDPGQAGAGRGGRGADPHRRRGAGEELLGREEGARRAQGRVGQEQGGARSARRSSRPSTSSSPGSRARWRARTATSRRRSGGRRRRWRPPTSSPSWPTPRSSR